MADDNQTATTPGAEEGATPTEGQEPQANTQPGTEGASTGQEGEDETVTLSKADHEKLQGDLKQARDLQSQSDKARRAAERKARILESRAKGGAENGDGQTADPAPVDLEYTDTEKQQIMGQAEKGVLQLLVGNDQYREVLNNDPTLKDIISKNPLALITEYIDAEDAVEQIKEMLDGRVASSDTQDGKGANNEQGDGQSPSETKDVQTRGQTQGSGNTLTPEQAAALPMEQYEKIPENLRAQLREGKTVTLSS